MSETRLTQAPLIAAGRKHQAAGRRQQGKIRQAAKIKELQRVLLAHGYKSAGQQAALLGLKRSTVWAIFKSEHARGGMSSSTVKRMLAAKGIPKAVKKVINEYLIEKLSGAYGHEQAALKLFRSRAGLTADANWAGELDTTSRISAATFRQSAPQLGADTEFQNENA
jgi:predicted DNA-binding transcriptional regulator AlpA